MYWPILCRRRNDRILVVINLGKDAVTFTIDHPALPGNYVNLFSGLPNEIKRRETFAFQPGEYLVYHITH